jgi:hypothetical protein
MNKLSQRIFRSNLIVLLVLVLSLGCNRYPPLDSEVKIREIAKSRLNDYCKRERINCRLFKIERIEQQPEHDGFGERWDVVFMSVENKNNKTLLRTFEFFKYRNNFEESSHGISVISK